jgi:Lrp/AsnC family transcriptional regulator, leucine-responsive regulatory protein
LRRVKTLVESGLIERQIAVLSPDKLAAIQGYGLTAIVEITLDRQCAEHLEAFETRVIQDSGVQQCYRLSPGPDFCLVTYCADMPAYLALANRLFTQDANVRNVKAFFSLKRAKFEPKINLSPQK